MRWQFGCNSGQLTRLLETLLISSFSLCFIYLLLNIWNPNQVFMASYWIAFKYNPAELKSFYARLFVLNEEPFFIGFGCHSICVRMETKFLWIILDGKAFFSFALNFKVVSCSRKVYGIVQSCSIKIYLITFPCNRLCNCQTLCVQVFAFSTLRQLYILF